MSEKYTIMQDPSIPGNWGIVWENSGTCGGFTSPDAAEAQAKREGGSRATADEAQTWEW